MTEVRRDTQEPIIQQAAVPSDHVLASATPPESSLVCSIRRPEPQSLDLTNPFANPTSTINPEATTGRNRETNAQLSDGTRYALRETRNADGTLSRRQIGYYDQAFGMDVYKNEQYGAGGALSRADRRITYDNGTRQTIAENFTGPQGQERLLDSTVTNYDSSNPPRETGRTVTQNRYNDCGMLESTTVTSLDAAGHQVSAVVTTVDQFNGQGQPERSTVTTYGAANDEAHRTGQTTNDYEYRDDGSRVVTETNLDRSTRQTTFRADGSVTMTARDRDGQVTRTLEAGAGFLDRLGDAGQVLIPGQPARTPEQAREHAINLLTEMSHGSPGTALETLGRLSSLDNNNPQNGPTKLDDAVRRMGEIGHGKSIWGYRELQNFSSNHDFATGVHNFCQLGRENSGQVLSQYIAHIGGMFQSIGHGDFTSTLAHAGALGNDSGAAANALQQYVMGNPEVAQRVAEQLGSENASHGLRVGTMLCDGHSCRVAGTLEEYGDGHGIPAGVCTLSSLAADGRPDTAVCHIRELGDDGQGNLSGERGTANLRQLSETGTMAGARNVLFNLGNENVDTGFSTLLTGFSDSTDGVHHDGTRATHNFVQEVGGGSGERALVVLQPYSTDGTYATAVQTMRLAGATGALDAQGQPITSIEAALPSLRSISPDGTIANAQVTLNQLGDGQGVPQGMRNGLRLTDGVGTRIGATLTELSDGQGVTAGVSRLQSFSSDHTCTTSVNNIVDTLGNGSGQTGMTNLHRLSETGTFAGSHDVLLNLGDQNIDKGFTTLVGGFSDNNNGTQATHNFVDRVGGGSGERALTVLQPYSTDGTYTTAVATMRLAGTDGTIGPDGRPRTSIEAALPNLERISPTGTVADAHLTLEQLSPTGSVPQGLTQLGRLAPDVNGTGVTNMTTATNNFAAFGPTPQASLDNLAALSSTGRAYDGIEAARTAGNGDAGVTIAALQAYGQSQGIADANQPNAMAANIAAFKANNGITDGNTGSANPNGRTMEQALATLTANYVANASIQPAPGADRQPVVQTSGTDATAASSVARNATSSYATDSSVAAAAGNNGLTIPVSVGAGSTSSLPRLNGTDIPTVTLTSNNTVSGLTVRDVASSSSTDGSNDTWRRFAMFGGFVGAAGSAGQIDNAVAMTAAYRALVASGADSTGHISALPGLTGTPGIVSAQGNAAIISAQGSQAITAAQIVANGSGQGLTNLTIVAGADRLPGQATTNVAGTNVTHVESPNATHVASAAVTPPTVIADAQVFRAVGGPGAVVSHSEASVASVNGPVIYRVGSTAGIEGTTTSAGTTGSGNLGIGRFVGPVGPGDLVARSEAIKKLRRANRTRGLRLSDDDLALLGADIAIAALLISASVSRDRTRKMRAEAKRASSEELAKAAQGAELLAELNQDDNSRQKYKVLARPTWIVRPNEDLVKLAEHLFHEGELGWLIADLNVNNIKERVIDGKRVVELQVRQRLELPVWQDIVEFHKHAAASIKAENLITIVNQTAIDRDVMNNALATAMGVTTKPAIAIVKPAAAPALQPVAARISSSVSTWNAKHVLTRLADAAEQPEGAMPAATVKPKKTVVALARKTASAVRSLSQSKDDGPTASAPVTEEAPVLKPKYV
jgi:hypothetical protein